MSTGCWNAVVKELVHTLTGFRTKNSDCWRTQHGFLLVCFPGGSEGFMVNALICRPALTTCALCILPHCAGIELLFSSDVVQQVVCVYTLVRVHVCLRLCLWWGGLWAHKMS